MCVRDAHIIQLPHSQNIKRYSISVRNASIIQLTCPQNIKTVAKCQANAKTYKPPKNPKFRQAMRTIALFAKTTKFQQKHSSNVIPNKSSANSKFNVCMQRVHNQVTPFAVYFQMRTKVNQALLSKKRPSNLYSKNHYMYPTGKVHKNQTKPITNGKPLRPSHSSQSTTTNYPGQHTPRYSTIYTKLKQNKLYNQKSYQTRLR